MHTDKNLIILVIFTIYKATSCVPTLEVTANAGQHPISPYIYGINFAEDTDFAKEIKLPLDRWGGEEMTRYNWKIDVTNHARDWYFENIAKDNPHPETLPDGSLFDRFVDKDRLLGAKTMTTVPLIGWTPKDRVRRCGFSVKKYGPQQQMDQWAPDCGNGLKPDGKTLITGNNPTDTAMPINSTFAEEWVQHLVKKYGTADKGGVKWYQMDNEYDLWQSIHRDVRPKGCGTDEFIRLTEEYGSAVKKADPSAQVLGPVGWSLMSLLKSGKDLDENCDNDRKAHDNIDFAAYYLKRMKQYEDQHKTRLLDYLDCHIYPQADKVFTDNSDPKVAEVRLRSTRSFWDPTYVDESWLANMGEPNNRVQFIPRMKNYINQYYPGTKVAITEYNWGGQQSISGALAQADILGILGREGVELAALWGTGKNTEPWAFAFRMFRNYDGKGSQFGDTSVTAKSSDQQQLAIYASTRSDKKLVIVVINKEPNTAIDTKIAINGFDHSDTANVFTYSGANTTRIVQATTKIEPKELSYKFPAYSITLFEISPK